MREGGGSCEAQAVAVAEAILINRRSSFFATFAFFAANTSESSVEIVLGFDTKDGWIVVEWRLIPSISGLGNG